MKKSLLFLLGIIATLFIFSMSAHADGFTDGWTVLKCTTDANNGVNLIVTDDGGSTTQTFWPALDAGYPNQALALCLTAKTNGDVIFVGNFSAGRFTSLLLQDPVSP